MEVQAGADTCSASGEELLATLLPGRRAFPGETVSVPAEFSCSSYKAINIIMGAPP